MVKSTSGKTTRSGCQQQYLEERLPLKLLLLRDAAKPSAKLGAPAAPAESLPKMHSPAPNIFKEPSLAKPSGAGSSFLVEKQASLLDSVLQVLAVSESDLESTTDMASLGELVPLNIWQHDCLVHPIVLTYCPLSMFTALPCTQNCKLLKEDTLNNDVDTFADLLSDVRRSLSDRLRCHHCQFDRTLSLDMQESLSFHFIPFLDRLALTGPV